MRHKYQTINVVVPAATAASAYPITKVKLDANYKRAVGLAGYEVSNPSSDKYSVEIRAGGTTIQDKTTSQDFVSTTGTPITTRYKEVDIPTNVDIEVIITPLVLSVGIIQLDLVFKLSNEE